jgi:phage tail tube protein FII
MSFADVTAWNAKFLDINNAPTKVSGLITEVKAPKLEREFDTTKRMGELGIVPRPKHLKEIEISFTCKRVSKAFNKALWEALGTINKTVSLQATSVIDTDAATREINIWTATGYLSSTGLGDLSGDGIESEVKIMCIKLDASFGTDTFQYDPVNYIYSVNGVNLWASIKTAIGV